MQRKILQKRLPRGSQDDKMDKRQGRGKQMKQNFMKEISGKEREVQDARLWERLKEMQGELFYTSSGLEFTYRIKGGE